MTPATGARLLRFVGDKVRITLHDPAPGLPGQFRAFLRTNLGRAAARRREILAAHAGRAVVANSSWRDLPMQQTPDGWQIELPLTETGYFQAKAYWLDEKNWQHWPEGADLGICVHPDFARTANTIYCAFTRLFGETKTQRNTADENLEAQLKSLESKGYATLPPSGKFRDLTRLLPHIINELGCRIIHLLPVHPTPTTYARFGRFGSPYAALDLTAVDPALVEFDKRTTGIDQFCELTEAAHALGARVFIDIVINHTGWGSQLQENHPEFFLKTPSGEFASPGAWGTVWEDLVELEQHAVKLWDLIADSLLTWCRRGVDGFRCDAGYKIPVPAWQYIVARIQEEFPDTIFLLEGLGGSWEATEQLLTEGGMQWAYSELFQNYSGKEVAWYLDYANRQNERVGTYVHYSETHDNNRLAALGRPWSLLRNRLCALTSPSGGFGFTCGVEWLADEKIRVHGNTGLNWAAPDNLVAEISRANRLLADHPCFFDGATLTRLSPPESPVYALLRESAEGKDSILVLCNTDMGKAQPIALLTSDPRFDLSRFQNELLGQALPAATASTGRITFLLDPGASYCLSPLVKPAGLGGEAYRRVRAQAAFALRALNQAVPIEAMDGLDWQWLAAQIDSSPKHFLAAIATFGAAAPGANLKDILTLISSQTAPPSVIVWTLADARRLTPVPAGHWLLVEDSVPFRAALEGPSANAGEVWQPWMPVRVQSIPSGDKYVAAFAPPQLAGTAQLTLSRPAATLKRLSATVRFLTAEPIVKLPARAVPAPEDMVLLTNDIGGMARLCVDLGRINSKYDCALGANLNPEVPVDRHVFIKRIRVWVNADGFLSALDYKSLVAFRPGTPAVWDFVANAGDGRTVEIQLRAEMVPGKNTTVFHFTRPTEELALGKQLPADADVRLTVRADIEDRNFHSETRRNGGADFHFHSNTRELKDSLAQTNKDKTRKTSTKPLPGFEFTPAADRQLRIFADAGVYHPQPEWCENIPHPVEQTRGQVGSGDAYSPGWFELPLAKGAQVQLVATAEINTAPVLPSPPLPRTAEVADSFESQLVRAARQFVVRRNEGKTVIAGYPWFLDWGRDSLICARGLLAAGMVEEVRQLLLTFAKFEDHGTLPNTIHGNDVSNRDTSDAPLWFAVVCEELAAARRTKAGAFFDTKVNDQGRTLREVLTSIAQNYQRGTPNGIHMDPDSALIWSPSHFTWMDTNYPAGTPREGYPVEIQALWIRLLRLLGQISGTVDAKRWNELADHARASFDHLFWVESAGWFADVLLGGPRVIARDAVVDGALRSNCLFAISLGLVSGERAKRCVEAAQKYLVVPGALRTLAPLPVSVPLAIYRDGQLLNDPSNPYWPRYEGDEDTRRKPAYHNGTAWTWTFPTFCEALARAWDQSPAAIAAAKSYLGSAEALLNTGCLGQLPEILDGDFPHTQRGCDAQAWGATETLRVWKWLKAI
jgi:predicted glycogen debranching enzyme